MLFLAISFLPTWIVSQTFSLTVQNGYGSGIYKAGDTVYVFSKELPNDSIVKQWTSADNIFIESKNEWKTRVVMPAKNTIIRCNWEYGAPVNEKQIQIKIGGIKRTVWYAIPNNPKGMVTLHHFTSGTGNLFWSRVEYKKLCHYLYAKGYALFSYNAYEVETIQGSAKKQWIILPMDLPSNPDHRAARDLVDSLEARNLINSNLPKFALGMSVGGSYTSSLAMALQWNGWVNFCTKGNANIYDSTNIDGFHIPSQHDWNDGADSDESLAYQNFMRLKNRLPNSVFQLHTRYPLHAQRFKKVAAINANEANNLFNNLKSKGFLNAKEEPIMQSDTLEYVAANFPNQLPAWSALGEDVRKECVYQYRAAFADHELTMDYNFAIYQFFESHLVKTNSVISDIKSPTVHIYPNPGSGILHIHCSENIALLEIIHSTGKLVYVEKIGNSKSAEMNTDALQSGYYFIKINGQIAERWIKI